MHELSEDQVKRAVETNRRDSMQGDLVKTRGPKQNTDSRQRPVDTTRDESLSGQVARPARAAHVATHSRPAAAAQVAVLKPRHLADHLVLGALLASSCTFLAAFAIYVVLPAVTTLVGSSANTWQQGF